MSLCIPKTFLHWVFLYHIPETLKGIAKKCTNSCSTLAKNRNKVTEKVISEYAPLLSSCTSATILRTSLEWPLCLIGLFGTGVSMWGNASHHYSQKVSQKQYKQPPCVTQYCFSNRIQALPLYWVIPFEYFKRKCISFLLFVMCALVDPYHIIFYNIPLIGHWVPLYFSYCSFCIF